MSVDYSQTDLTPELLNYFHQIAWEQQKFSTRAYKSSVAHHGFTRTLAGSPRHNLVDDLKTLRRHIREEYHNPNL